MLTCALTCLHAFPAPRPRLLAVPRQALLRGRGWAVVAVPHWEWAALDSDDLRAAYLASRLLRGPAGGACAAG